MTEWPMGLSTGLFYRFQLIECLPWIRQAGFNQIEVCSSGDHLDYHSRHDVEEAGRMIADLGIETYSFHAPFREAIDITSPDLQRRRASEYEIFKAAEAAAALKARYFVFHPGPEQWFQPPVHERLQRMNNAVEVLNNVYRKCSELDIDLAIENMLPHLFCGSTKDILWLIGSVEKLEPAVCLDTGHAFLSGGAREMIRKVAGRLEMIHVNDNSGTADDHVPPGQGKIDWKQFILDLRTINFTGVLILELSPGQFTQKEQLLKMAMDSVHYLRDLIRQIGHDQKHPA
ncbi:MAG: sugar phosphate isomerase/epimerase [Planctomycetaceae bacterium]|nr:sugar phosphate isomerase/epimerase [Planctomycetaceae bacterium]